MNDLRDLMERSTDGIEAPSFAGGALVAARRRRTRARAVVASTVAVAAVTAVGVSMGVADDRPGGAGPAGPPSPTSPPTSSSGADIVQSKWDPRRVDRLPAASDDVMPLLPEVLRPPTESTPALADSPVDAAVLTVGREDAVKVLSVDGTWRHVGLPAGSSTVELSRDGTRLAVGTETGVDVWDIDSGTRTAVPYPDGRGALDDARWDWLDEATLLLDGQWEVDVRTGAAERVRETGGQFVVDDRGGIFEFSWDSGLSLLQVDGTTVAGVGFSDLAQSFAVSVAERSTGRPRHVLPVQVDGQSILSNGGLSVEALLDDGTVLLRLLVRDRGASSIRFVAWDPTTGDLSLVMRTLHVLPAWSVADGLL